MGVESIGVLINDIEVTPAGAMKNHHGFTLSLGSDICGLRLTRLRGLFAQEVRVRLFAPHFDITRLTDDSIHEMRNLTTVSTHTDHLLACISNLFHGYSLAWGSDI